MSPDKPTEPPVLRVIPGLLDNEQLIADARRQLALPPEDEAPAPTSEERSDLDLHDLAFLAERLLKAALSRLDFKSALAKGAALLVEDETDARTILQLIDQAKISVEIDLGELAR